MIRFTLFCLSILSCPVVSALGAAPPNVIVVMTDDQGYGDLSCHGNPIFQTPHLDRLHSESARFTDFHVAPMCTPTRGQLLTGLDAARNGAINVSSGRTLLRAGLPTIADVFAENGYRTGIFGKWHLGDTYPYRPQDRGFQETLWFPSSHINSVPDVWDNDYFDDTYRRNGELTKYEGYCTDVFFREAMDWIRSVQTGNEKQETKAPFFLYLPTNAAHTPYWLPENYRTAMTKTFAEAEASGRFTKKLPGKQRTSIIDFLAMIKNIDDNMGQLSEFLEETGLTENTVVVFLTDNGSTKGADYYNAEMWGRKTQLWEGGHRVPCFVKAPGVKPRDIAGLAQVQDLFPSLLSLCGIESKENTNGIDWLPVLKGEAALPEDRKLIINYSRMPFGFEFASPDSPSIMTRDMAAVLWKRWRLLEGNQLYNLDTDPLQRRNVIDQHPKIADAMQAHLDGWWDEVEATANEAQPVVIGHPAENPVLLTGCEWLDVFIDQQQQVRRADLKNGWWEIEVAEAGRYEFELRRWPREADLALDAGLPATPITDGTLLPGEALPIVKARLKIGQRPMQHRRLAPGAKSAVFSVKLEPGRTRLYTWFEDAEMQSLIGAYYVYVKRE